MGFKPPDRGFLSGLTPTARTLVVARSERLTGFLRAPLVKSAARGLFCFFVRMEVFAMTFIVREFVDFIRSAKSDPAAKAAVEELGELLLPVIMPGVTKGMQAHDAAVAAHPATTALVKSAAQAVAPPAGSPPTPASAAVTSTAAAGALAAAPTNNPAVASAGTQAAVAAVIPAP
jgi:hypothetical protein